VLVTRGLAAGRVPWGNMYEFVVTLTAIFAVGWLVLLVRRPACARWVSSSRGARGASWIRRAGPVTPAGPLVPALNSYWLKIHVTAAATASGLLLLGFIPAALFLIRAGYDAGKRRFPYPIGRNLPAADTLERLTFRLHTFRVPDLDAGRDLRRDLGRGGLGPVLGLGPERRHGRSSPGVAYAAYLHARATPSVKTTTATWFAVAAWGTMLINLYVINLSAVGLHSYAGVD
jgi:ABC-type transport system involved in cytochrome c biogenesis permease subunit